MSQHKSSMGHIARLCNDGPHLKNFPMNMRLVSICITNLPDFYKHDSALS
jgi:hypothetical protein